jgi:hypothetical protein
LRWAGERTRQDPSARVISPEPDGRAPTGRNHDGVSSEGVDLTFDHGRVDLWVVRLDVKGSVDEHEFVTVQVLEGHEERREVEGRV